MIRFLAQSMFFFVGFVSGGGILTAIVLLTLYALAPGWLEAHNEHFITGILWGTFGTRVGLWMQNTIAERIDTQEKIRGRRD